MTDSPLPQSAISVEHRFAIEIVRRLQTAGFTAYFAGGCVRDMLMGNEPHDFDVATNASFEQVKELFGSKNTLGIGASFGVACVHGRSEGVKCQVEVATFRSDGNYTDGRHPDWVRFTTADEDAKRRDFTINGIFFDPIAAKIIDFVEGQTDIRKRVIRAIGIPHDRFEEDKLRMLRAIRFAARFEFEIDAATFNAIVDLAPTICVVSGERISAELKKILQMPTRCWALRKLFDSRLLETIFPELACRWLEPASKETDLHLIGSLPSEYIDERTTLSTMLMNLSTSPTSPIDSAASELIETKVKNRWRLSNEEVESCLFTLKARDTLINAVHVPWSQLQPLLISRYASDACRVAYGYAIANNLSLDGVELCFTKLSLTDEQLNPKPLVTGDVLKKIGIPPGPEYAKLLNEIRCQQLDGVLKTPEQALDWLRSLRN